MGVFDKMREFAYNDTEFIFEKKIKKFTENDLRNEYENSDKPYVSFEDFLEDWKIINWGWEIK